MEGRNDSSRMTEMNVLVERTQLEPARTGYHVSPWQTYCQMVEKHLFAFEFADDAISRLLFFSPLSSDATKGSSRWRQVVWGLLQLHRLTIDIALRHRRCLPMDGNPYGATIAVQDPSRPALTIRIALTVLQSLGPTLQELVCSTATDHVIMASRQSRTRAAVERVRFLLRGYLLAHYWQRMWSATRLVESCRTSPVSTTVAPGLMMDGGLFPSRCAVYSLHQEQARLEREQYVGRRTGRRVVARNGSAPTVEVLTTAAANGVGHGAAIGTTRVLIGEILYVLRPLCQVESELSGAKPPIVSWILCLGMDVSSLWSLRLAAKRGNPATRNEWNRRRLRLLLYLLRVPVWESITEPASDRVSQALDKVPLFGKLCSNYLREWLYYWRFYRAEEG